MKKRKKKLLRSSSFSRAARTRKSGVFPTSPLYLTVLRPVSWSSCGYMFTCQSTRAWNFTGFLHEGDQENWILVFSDLLGMSVDTRTCASLRGLWVVFRTFPTCWRTFGDDFWKILRIQCVAWFNSDSCTASVYVGFDDVYTLSTCRWTLDPEV